MRSREPDPKRRKRAFHHPLGCFAEKSAGPSDDDSRILTWFNCEKSLSFAKFVRNGLKKLTFGDINYTAGELVTQEPVSASFVAKHLRYEP